MQEISVVTIGLTLLGFLLGAVLVGIAAQSRARRQHEAHAEQVRLLREEERLRLASLESAEIAKSEVEERLQEAERTIGAGLRETEILRAQFQEEQEAAFGLEDRLNAAEARVLTMEAELAQHNLELQRWHAAYHRLKESHVRLADAHHQVRTREEELSHSLESGRDEMDALQVRLNALQTALATVLRTSLATEGDEVASTAIVPAQLQEIALAKAEVEMALQRREQELTELRSQLAATRFSVNILAATGAELAAQLAPDQTRSEPAVPAPLPRLPRVSSPEARGEQLADLESIIVDWFDEVRDDLPYSQALLQSFAGRRASTRYYAAQEVEGESEDDLSAPDLQALNEWLAHAEQGMDDVDARITPDVMLAAIKAANVAALRRSKAREHELVVALEAAQRELKQAESAIAQQNALVLGDVQDGADELSEVSEESVDQPIAQQTDTDEMSVPVEDALAPVESASTPLAATPLVADTVPHSEATRTAGSAVTAAPSRPIYPAGIPRPDVPTPATPRATVPVPAAPGQSADTTDSPQLRSAWNRFLRRVETVLQRPGGRGR